MKKILAILAIINFSFILSMEKETLESQFGTVPALIDEAEEVSLSAQDTLSTLEEIRQEFISKEKQHKKDYPLLQSRTYNTFEQFHEGLKNDDPMAVGKLLTIGCVLSKLAIDMMLDITTIEDENQKPK